MTLLVLLLFTFIRIKRSVVGIVAMSDCQKAAICIILALGLKRKIKRRVWVKEWLKKREIFSHTILLKEISYTDPDDYRNYFRMSENLYNTLLNKVQPLIERQDTAMRKSIPVTKKLATTLRYLATGRNFEDLKFTSIMSPVSVSAAVIETCEALIYVLQDYLKFPTSQAEWTEIATDFSHLHQFYNTCGAIDGKHVAIEKPTKSGALYYNYKGFHSIVLLAVVNAKKEFIMVDAGINGRISDGGVMYYSKFGELLQQGMLNLPPPASLPNTQKEFPFIFVGDEAFALNDNLLKPYSQKTLNPQRHEFNRRLSRARVVVENAFGMLVKKFGVFQQAIKLEPKKAEIVTMAACMLHNFLSKENKEEYLSSSLCNGDIVDALIGLESTKSRNSGNSAKVSRDTFCDYYNTTGKV